MKPFNDNLKIELPTSDFIVSKDDEDMSSPLAGTGTVNAIPEIDDIMYFGSYNWAFDKSMLDQKTAHQIHAKMTALLGKEVLFEGISRGSGLTWEEDDKTFCFVKLAKIIGFKL